MLKKRKKTSQSKKCKKFPSRERIQPIKYKKHINVTSNKDIIVLFGQSNSANSVISKEYSKSKHLNYFNKKFYPLSNPALGANGDKDSIAPAIAAKLQSKNPYIFLTNGWGGTSIYDWSHPNSMLVKYVKKNLYKQTLLKACMESRFEDVKTLITEHANEDFEGTILNEEHLCHIINGKTRDSNLTDVQVDIVEYLLQHVVTIHPRDSQAKNELDTAITKNWVPFKIFGVFNFVSKWSYKTSALLAAFDKVLHIEDNQLPANVQRLIKILLLKMPDDENTHNFFCSLIHRFNNNNCHRYLEHLFQIHSNQFGFQTRYSYGKATIVHLLQRYRFNYVKLFVARHKI